MASAASRLALDLRNHQTTATFPVVKWYDLQQQRDWVLNPFSSDSYAYNYPLASRLTGALDVAALRNSLQQIVQRHEPLRSRFQVVDGELQQTIAAPTPIPFREVSVSMVSPLDAESSIRDLCVRECSYPFDLTQDLLLRAKLFQISPNDHVLLLVSHRIAFDDWSAGVLLRELSTLYSQFQQHKSAQLEPLTYSYSRFADDLHQQIRKGQLRRESDYWSAHLRGRTNFEYLETRAFQQSSARSHGNHQTLLCSPDTRARIERVAYAAQATPFMVLSAVLLRLIAEASGDPDAAITCCVANRNRIETEDLIGPFSNRVFLRAKLAEQTFASAVLQRVREAAFDAYAAQELPYGEILETVAASQPHHGKPKTQFVITTLQHSTQDLSLPEVHASQFDFFPDSTCYDIFVTLNFHPQADLAIDFVYRTALFEAETIALLAQQFDAALHQFLSESENTSAAAFQAPAAPSTLASAGVPTAAPELSPSPVEQQLLQIWADVLQRDSNSIALNDRFFDLGGDSLRAVRLFNAIETRFGKKIAVTELLHRPTIQSLALALGNEVLAPRQPACLIPLQPNGSRPPIFCIHAREGDALPFRNFPDFLGDDQPVFALQSPYLNGGTPLLTVEEMADHYLAEIRRVQPTGPYHFFGYCFGGTVAFEMSLRLQAIGEQVGFLGMYYTSPPRSLGAYPFPPIASLPKRALAKIRRMRSQNFQQNLDLVAATGTDAARVAGRSARIAGWQGLMHLLGLRAAANMGMNNQDINYIHVIAAKNYLPRTSFRGRIRYFLPTNISYEYSIPPEKGWNPFVTDGVQLIKVDREPGRSAPETFTKIVSKTVRAYMDVRVTDVGKAQSA